MNEQKIVEAQLDMIKADMNKFMEIIEIVNAPENLHLTNEEFFNATPDLTNEIVNYYYSNLSCERLITLYKTISSILKFVDEVVAYRQDHFDDHDHKHCIAEYENLNALASEDLDEWYETLYCKRIS